MRKESTNMSTLCIYLRKMVNNNRIRMPGKVLIFCFLLVFTRIVIAGDGNHEPGMLSTIYATQSNKASSLKGLNIKLIPAFFWNTVGIEVEYPLSMKLSLGTQLTGVLGRNDVGKNKFRVRPEGYHESGFGADIFVRYYFKENAPEGLYAQVYLSYSNYIYFDGNTRPFTLHNNWKETEKFRLANDIEKPLPYTGGLGVGYQIKFVPNLIGNVFLGIQGQMSNENEIMISVFLTPGIGYLF